MIERQTTRPLRCVICKESFQQDLSGPAVELDFTCGKQECRLQLEEQRMIEVSLEGFEAEPTEDVHPRDLKSEAEKARAFFGAQDLAPDSMVKRFTVPRAEAADRDRLLHGVADLASAATRLSDPEALQLVRLAREWLERILVRLEGGG